MKTKNISRALGLITILLCSVCAGAQVSVLTQHNDNSRSGQNLNETTLNTSNVNVSNFGKVFFRTVDGDIYAQPLLVSNLAIQGQTRNVLYVATEHNSVFAFDADDPVATAPLWQVNVGTSVPAQDICNVSATDGCNGQYWGDIAPEIGITGTPVIDSNSSTIYFVAKTKNTSDNSYHFYLHALDLATGAEKFAGPVEITIPSSSPVAFTPLAQLQRPGLLLLNGAVFVAFGSAGDFLDWHGWVVGYDASTLAQLGFFVSTPGNKVFDSGGETGGGGIFAAGQGLVGDTNSNLYFATGNGPYDANTGGADYGDSVIKLAAPALTLQDYFTPDDASFLGANNMDVGAGGPMLIPGTNLLVGGGKDGILRLTNTNNLGKFNVSSNNDVQELQVSSSWIHGSTVYWDAPSGQMIYLWTSGDPLRAWLFNGSTLQTTPVSQSTFSSPGGQCDTSPLSLSANLSTAGTGIIWAPTSNAGDPGFGIQPGILHAFDASKLSTELWNSEQNSVRDTVGNFAKFTVSTVANGKVYLPTFSGQVAVYGLNPPPAGIHFVQVAAATPASGSQVSQSFSTAQTAGDLNIVVVSSDPTSNVSSVRDSLGNSYALAVGPTTGTANKQSIYYAKNIAAGSDTVTVTFNQSADYPEVRIFEYAGLDTVSPFDASSAGMGSGVNADSGPATTTAANELIFAANAVSNNNFGPGSPFIARLVLSGGDLVEDRIVNVANTYDAQSQLGSLSAGVLESGNWVMQMATFKAAAIAPADFSISASPSSASVSTGSSVNDTISVGGLNGFSSPVTLACSGLPSGASCAFNPASVSPNSNPATSTLTISTASGTAANTYNVTITGTSGSLSHNASVSLTVGTTANFSISVTSPVTVAAGSSIASTVSISPANGFNGAVNLACSAGLPTGAACSFSPASATGSSTLSITTTAATPIGSYPITVTGTSGSLTNPATVTLTVTAGGGSFSLSTPSPAAATVAAGSSATFTATVTPTGSFSGTVTLSCVIATSASPAPVCSSANVTVNGTAVQTTLTLTTTAPHTSRAPSSRIFYALLLPLGGLTLFGASGVSRRKKVLSLLLMFLAASGLLFFSACGGGSSSSSAPPGGGSTTGGTPAGTYTVTVTGTSGSLTAPSTMFTLTVQ
jgi:hypothetical protein